MGLTRILIIGMLVNEVALATVETESTESQTGNDESSYPNAVPEAEPPAQAPPGEKSNQGDDLQTASDPDASQSSAVYQPEAQTGLIPQSNSAEAVKQSNVVSPNADDRVVMEAEIPVGGSIGEATADDPEGKPAVAPEAPKQEDTFEQKLIKAERVMFTQDPLSKVLDELYGDSMEWFGVPGEREEEKFTLVVNCNNPQDDSDYKVNLVTTLCPFLRSGETSPCGAIRRASYQFDDDKKLCSSDCTPHLNALLEAYRRRDHLSHRHEIAVFRDIANQIILQYAGICRLGSSPRPEN